MSADGDGFVAVGLLLEEGAGAVLVVNAENAGEVAATGDAKPADQVPGE
jgi:hypothetical protein